MWCIVYKKFHICVVPKNLIRFSFTINLFLSTKLVAHSRAVKYSSIFYCIFPVVLTLAVKLIFDLILGSDISSEVGILFHTRT